MRYNYLHLDTSNQVQMDNHAQMESISSRYLSTKNSPSYSADLREIAPF